MPASTLAAEVETVGQFVTSTLPADAPPRLAEAEFRLERCRCGLLRWHDPDAELLAVLAGSFYKPRCWCNDEDRREPSWVGLPSGLPVEGWEHLVGQDRHWSIMIPSSGTIVPLPGPFGIPTAALEALYSRVGHAL